MVWRVFYTYVHPLLSHSLSHTSIHYLSPTPLSHSQLHIHPSSLLPHPTLILHRRVHSILSLIPLSLIHIHPFILSYPPLSLPFFTGGSNTQPPPVYAIRNGENRLATFVTYARAYQPGVCVCVCATVRVKVHRTPLQASAVVDLLRFLHSPWQNRRVHRRAFESLLHPPTHPPTHLFTYLPYLYTYLSYTYIHNRGGHRRGLRLL